jgi:hypothetical protein
MISTLDYPSVQAGAISPPSPMLLDTCVIQHLSYVTGVIDWDDWTEDATAAVVSRVGPNLGTELLALMSVLERFSDSGSLVWAASWTAADEIARARGARGARVRRQRTDLYHWWEAMVAEWPGELGHTEVSVQALPGPEQMQLPLRPEPEIVRPRAARFGPFRDAGDRELILEAVDRGFPAILTTDLRTLWRHRKWLYPAIEIWRPSDVMRVYGGCPERLV